MDFDLECEREAQGRGYRACWVGFSLYAFNLVVASLIQTATLFLFFTGQNPNLAVWLRIDAVQFDLGLDTLQAWVRLLACLSLVGAWPANPGWRRRAGLLLMMAIGDVILWGVFNAVPLGLASEATRHMVFFRYLRTTLGWSRFLLVASLASDFARHAGMPGADEFGKAARSTATTGAAVWFIYFLSRIQWSQPWPMAERRMTFEVFHLLIAGEVIKLLCLIQAGLLALLASRAASAALRAKRREEASFNPWSGAAPSPEPVGSGR
jgi:hypothetical protein